MSVKHRRLLDAVDEWVSGELAAGYELDDVWWETTLTFHPGAPSQWAVLVYLSLPSLAQIGTRAATVLPLPVEVAVDQHRVRDGVTQAMAHLKAQRRAELAHLNGVGTDGPAAPPGPTGLLRPPHT